MYFGNVVKLLLVATHMNVTYFPHEAESRLSEKDLKCVIVSSYLEKFFFI